MKKKVLFAFLLVTTIPMFSFNWNKGLLINDDTKITSEGFNGFTLTQSNGANLWSSFVFDKNATTRLDIEGSYKYIYTLPSGGTSTFKQVLDIPLLKFSTNFNITKSKKIAIKAGRYFVTDISSVVMAQVCDGLNVQYQGYYTNFSVYVGTTGLLNKFNTTMYGKEYSDAVYYLLNKPTVTTYDYLVNGITSIGDLNIPTKLSVSSSDNFYCMSDAYIPVIATVNIPTFLGNSSLNAQCMAIFDVAKASYNRYYASALLESPISSYMNYRFTTVFSTESFNGFSNFTSLSFSFIPNNHILLTIGGDFASGELWGFSKFYGFTYIPSDDSSSKPGYSSRLMPKASFMFVGNKSYTSLEEKAIFNIKNGGFVFNGLNSKLTETVNIFSELQLSVIASAYIDFTNFSKNFYSANLKLSFSL